MRRDLEKPVFKAVQAGITTGHFLMAMAAVLWVAGCAKPDGHPSQIDTEGEGSELQAPMYRVLPAEISSRAEDWGLSKAVSIDWPFMLLGNGVVRHD